MRQTPINTTQLTYIPGIKYSRTSFRQDSISSEFKNSLYRTLVEVKTPSFTDNWLAVKRASQRMKPLSYYHSNYQRLALRGEWVETKSFMDSTVYPPQGPYILESYRENGVMTWVGPAPPETPIDYLSARLDAQARTALLLKLKDQKFNGIQTFAESSQLQKMVGGATMKIAETLHWLRRGNLLGAASTLGLTVGKRSAQRYRQRHKGLKTRDDVDQMLASGVLAVQYGIRPLLSDIDGAARLLSQKLTDDVYNAVKTSKTGQHETLWTDSGSVTGLKSSRKVLIDHKVTYGLTYGRGNEVFHTLAQLGVSNPLLIAWELTPWSFVIDWFLPIGNYLSSIDATLGLTFIDGYKSEKITYHEVDSQTMAAPTPGGYSSGQWSGSFRQALFSRTRLAAFPQVSLPRFKNPASFEHALNGIALLAAFKKTVYKGVT